MKKHASNFKEELRDFLSPFACEAQNFEEVYELSFTIRSQINATDNNKNKQKEFNKKGLEIWARHTNFQEYFCKRYAQDIVIKNKVKSVLEKHGWQNHVKLDAIYHRAIWILAEKIKNDGYKNKNNRGTIAITKFLKMTSRNIWLRHENNPITPKNRNINFSNPEDLAKMPDEIKKNPLIIIEENKELRERVNNILRAVGDKCQFILMQDIDKGLTRAEKVEIYNEELDETVDKAQYAHKLSDCKKKFKRLFKK